MNRNDLVQRLAAAAGLKTSRARQLVDLLFGPVVGGGLISDALDHGDRVSIAGFGTFVVRERAACALRDPRTGVPRPVRARRVAVFRAGSGLRSRLR